MQSEGEASAEVVATTESTDHTTRSSEASQGEILHISPVDGQTVSGCGFQTELDSQAPLSQPIVSPSSIIPSTSINGATVLPSNGDGAPSIVVEGDASVLPTATSAEAPAVKSPSHAVPRPDGYDSAVAVSRLQASVEPESLAEADMDANVLKIDSCCQEWRAGRVKPYWMIINEPKFGRSQGCAVRIQLAEHTCRVWSVDTVHEGAVLAKKACAEAALADGILEFIKHGDGQIKPAPPSNDPPIPSVSDTPVYSVQSFYDTLPRPLPEPVGDKSANDINGSAWLNTMIQSTRGAKLAAKYIWTINNTMNLHGCLLRLEHPGECMSYMVDPKFSKRAEAKAAVCLLAMSQGVGNYIRAIVSEVETRLPPDIRKRAAEFLPLLLAEYHRIRPGVSPDFEYTVDQDACGCTMTVQLFATPTPDQIRTYSVSTDYRSRNDAKSAVLYIAAQQGVIEFLKFRGTQPPPGYVPFDILSIYAGSGDMNRKRKFDYDGGGTGEYKRFRPNGGFQGNFSDGYQNGFNGNTNPRGSWNRGGGPARGNRFQNRSWTKPYGRGPDETGGGGFPMNQFQAGPAALPLQGFPQAPHPAQQGPPGGGGFAQGAPYMYNQGGVVNGGSGPAFYAQPAPPFATSPSGPYYAQPSSAGSNAAAYGAAGVSYPYSQNAAPYAAGAPQYPQPFQMGRPGAPAVVYPHGYQQGYQYSAVPPHAPPGGYPAAAPPHGYPSSSFAAPAPTNNAAHPPGVTVAQPVAYAHHAQQAQAAAPYQHVSQPQLPAPPSVGMPIGAQAAPQLPSTTSWQQTNNSQPPPPRGGPGNRGRGGKSRGGGVTSGKVTIAVESAPKSNVTALYDYCRTAGLSTPQFCNEMVTQGQDMRHKVWVIVGKQRLELPTTFSSLSQGQERVAKKVLEQLHSQAGTNT